MGAIVALQPTFIQSQRQVEAGIGVRAVLMSMTVTAISMLGGSHVRTVMVNLVLTAPAGQGFTPAMFTAEAQRHPARRKPQHDKNHDHGK